jgi:RNA polymerase sigma-70 factor (ECF subfamily)
MAEQESDAILIERFVNCREESAFVALVQRHGPLVEGICRRVLRNEHDVEDVFQATFFCAGAESRRYCLAGVGG